MTTPKKPIARAMLEEFEREAVTTRRFLERLPDDKLAWRPHAKSMSAGQLGHHIAETPELALKAALADEMMPPNPSVREEASSVKDMLALMDRGAGYVRQTLPALTDARMQETFTIRLPDGSAFTPTREHFLRSVLLNHWYHHRGQFGVYLRLLGAQVPSSYGPSADEAGGI